MRYSLWDLLTFPILCVFTIPVITLAVAYGLQWRLRYLWRSRPHSQRTHVARTVLLVLIIFAAASLTTDTMASTIPMFLFWTMLVLIDRTAAIAQAEDTLVPPYRAEH